MQQPPSPSSTSIGILCGQPTDDVILIDIAASLSSPSCFQRKNSVAPIAEPFVVSEPRSGVPFDQGLLDRYEEKKAWIHSSLGVLHSNFKSCLPLKSPGASIAINDQDGKLEPEDCEHDDEEPDLLAFQENLGAAWNSYHEVGTHVDLTAISLQQLSLVDIYGAVHTNSLLYWLTLKLNIGQHHEYIIPPKSSFLLGPFTSTIPIFNTFSRSFESPGFDFILLDPPWPNRSAHRAKHKNSYKTSTFDPYDLFKLNIPKSIRQDGVVAIWITNSTKWRKFTLEKLFQAWRLRMVAEWIWVKIAVNGEPIFNLDNIARKPYESLILAKPISNSDASPSMINNVQQLKDKIILAAPDIHSRKPCLKGLMEPYLSSRDPRCCEIFARNLTEGWFSWGNEVLKGNWRGCWV
ncbi:hypothetical protein ABW20_dc0104422 [Dactylellina cionopaga]|nr:hypothetical protein ABW20_dc0104422 [Dactylellina cionopaga]